MKMNIVFAGFRHGHIFDLWNKAKKNPDIKILGAWEENDAAREAAAKSNGVDFNYSTYQAVLEDKSVDIIAIGDYFGKRGSLAIKALRAGKHVMVDKPLCTSIEELDEIEKLSKEKNLCVSCMYSMRYVESTIAVKGIIESGKLGKIHSIFFSGQHPLNYGSRPAWYYEEGKHGGVINDIGIHGIDFIEYTMGLRPVKVLAAREWNAFATAEPHFKDSAQFMIELDNGAGVIADVSYAAPTSFSYSLPTYWAFNIWGSGGMLKFVSGVNDVEAYFEGSKEAVHFGGDKPDSDYITDILAEINGEGNSIITTSAVLQSARDTLLIQKGVT